MLNFQGSQLFSGQPIFLGNQTSQKLNFFWEVEFSGKPDFSREVNFIGKSPVPGSHIYWEVTCPNLSKKAFPGSQLFRGVNFSGK